MKKIIMGDLHCGHESQKEISQDFEVIMLSGDYVDTGIQNKAEISKILKQIPVIKIESVFDLHKLMIFENHDLRKNRLSI